MPAYPRINPVILRYTVAELAAKGVDSAPLFRGMGFTAEVLNSDPLFVVSHRQASDVIQRAIRLARDSGLGHNVGRRRTVVGSGFAGLGILTSNSPQEASRFIGNHAWAFGTLLALDSSMTPGNDLVLKARSQLSALEIESFFVDELFSSMFLMFKYLIGDDFAPRQIDLTCLRPPHCERMTEFFGCPVRFSQSQNRLVVDRGTAERLPSSADPVVHRDVIERLECLAKSFPTSDICSTVEQALRERADHPPTLPQLAALLNTSERTLRRRLHDQDTSYQQLLDGVRKEQALAMLRDSRAPISVVTQNLGFSDSRNFRRAIQRWTGVAPTTIRKNSKSIV